MLEVKFYTAVEDELLAFAVIVAKYKDKWVFCKHKDRSTYEVPGGRREKGEEILETAKRELFEETGAVEYDLRPIAIYSVTGKDGGIVQPMESYGMLYYATIYRFDSLPEYEIEEIVLMEDYPENWTYPLIQPFLMERVLSVINNS